MKKHTLVGVFLVLALLLSSCIDVFEPIEVSQEHLDGYCCVCAIPGTYTENAEDITCDLIETDEYGRRLLHYGAYSVITKSYVEALVICQKSESNTVFFYEDICYLPIENLSDAEVTSKVGDEELAAFKTQNDWSSPLKEERFSCRTVYYASSFSSYEMYGPKRLNRVLKRALKTDLKNVIWQDTDMRELREMYYVDTVDGRQYMVMVSYDENVYDELRIKLFEIENGVLDREGYAAFKRANAWEYGI